MGKASTKAQNKYISKAYDRINLTVPKGFKEEIKAYAEKQGESVNGFINRSITELTEMDNMHRAYQRSLLRYLEKAKDALDSNDLNEAKRILNALIVDTKADIK